MISQTTRGFNVIFIHSSLDDSGLTCQQFRVLAHLSRRASGGFAYPAIESMSETCKLHPDTVRKCIKELTRLKLLRVEANPGQPNKYFLTEPSEWAIHPPETKVPPSPEDKGGDPPESKGAEGNPVRKSNKEIQTSVELPNCLCDDRFVRAWMEWHDFRKEIKKTLAPSTERKQLKKLATMGLENAILSINQSIEAGWVGLFEPKDRSNRRSKPGNVPAGEDGWSPETFEKLTGVKLS